MARLAGRKDKAQYPIEEGLKARGIIYADYSNSGYGRPDLLVGYQGVNYLFEVKTATNEGQAKAKVAKNTKENKFMETWQGHYAIATTLEEVLKEIGYGETA